MLLRGGIVPTIGLDVSTVVDTFQVSYSGRARLSVGHGNAVMAFLEVQLDRPPIHIWASPASEDPQWSPGGATTWLAHRRSIDKQLLGEFGPIIHEKRYVV